MKGNKTNLDAKAKAVAAAKNDERERENLYLESRDQSIKLIVHSQYVHISKLNA